MAKYDEPLLNQIEEEEGDDEKILDVIERKNLAIPNLSERNVMKHFLHLSQMNYGVDTGFYPLGSCTMKYNPKLLERVVEEVKYIHPLQDEKTVQGCLQIMYELEKMLCEITGMDAFTLQPCAGAHGEFTGMLITHAYFESIGEGDVRKEVIVPDSAHGTNPASARMAGFDVMEIPSKNGRVDMDALRHVLSKETAAFMLTNPNTLGIFEKDIMEISREVKKVGALLYYDGANLNAIMGKTKPGIMGFDIVHVNLHKTFATPHGGGGPGAGPVGVKKHLEEFLPVPRIEKKGDGYTLNYNKPKSIGKVSHFYGNFSVLLKAYAYIMKKGRGLQSVAERAVLNSNYLMERLREIGYRVPYYGRRMHEFVLSLSDLKERGVRGIDVAKRLLDYGLHPPTVYFPLIIDEAFMIEPTEDETRQSMDEFVEAMKKIRDEKEEVLKNSPHNMPVGRVDEVKAVKNPILTWKDMD